MAEINLSPIEQQVLKRSSDSRITKRRRISVVVVGAAAAVLLVAAAWLGQSWQMVLAVSLIYVVVTVSEKVAYANAVLAYKSLIQKLVERVEELAQSQGDSRY